MFFFLFVFIQYAAFDAFSLTAEIKKPVLEREENHSPKKADRASGVFNGELEVENFVRSNFCPADEILSNEEALNATKKGLTDRLVACRSTCSMHGCTYRVFLSNNDGKLRLAGLVDGVCEAKNEADYGFRRIRCISTSAEQKVEVTWRYDGHQYR